MSDFFDELAFINHLGPYKGCLFPTDFGAHLAISVDKTFRSIHPELDFRGTVPAGLVHTVNDKDLQEIVKSHDFVGKDGKSLVYTHKVNTGLITLPHQLKLTMMDYGTTLATTLGIRPGGAFTVDYMISEDDGIYTLQPIELHTTPLGIFHDFKSTKMPQITEEFAQELAKISDKIVIYTSEKYLQNGFYSTEITGIAETLSNEGVNVKVTANPNELKQFQDWFIFPYKADFTSIQGVETPYPIQVGIDMEVKQIVNELLENVVISGVEKPTSQIVGTVPSFYSAGKTFCKPNSIVEDLVSYNSWKDRYSIPDLVVIKPIEHHQWNPQVLNLADPGDAKILFKQIAKYGETIVENMVQNNPVLGNGEVRVTYLVK